MPAPADWQLPPGVSRAVWDYAHDDTIARDYDRDLAGTPLLDADWQFVHRHIRPHSRVIDLGCGTGRLAIPLAQAGHAVTGVDLSLPMLAVAAAKSPRGLSLNWAQANIAELSALRSAEFDAAICMFSTLGMVDGGEARRRVVAEAFRLLRPSGVFIAHAHLMSHHLTTSAGRRLWLRDAGKRLLGRPGAGDMPMPAGPGRPGWTMHLFTRREFVRLLTDVGFVVTELLTVGIDGRPRRLCAYGLLAAARKPG